MREVDEALTKAGIELVFVAAPTKKLRHWAAAIQHC
jgi:hypothetical protein